MARLKGSILLEGSVDNLIFYRSKFGLLVRNKGTLNRNRIAEDPAFKRTRENNSEFGNAIKSGKLFRRTVQAMGHDVFDSQFTPRLNQLMTRIKSFDTVSERGQRIVANGIAHPETKKLLRSFNFNDQSLLTHVLLNPYELDIKSGVITLPDFEPAREVKFPEGSTHVILQSGMACIEFREEIGELITSQKMTLAKNGSATDLILAPNSAPGIAGISFFLLKISFSQLVNGEHYPLNNGVFNTMAIIEIETIPLVF